MGLRCMVTGRRRRKTLMAALLLGFLFDPVTSPAADADLRAGRLPLRLEADAALVDQARMTAGVSDVVSAEHVLRRLIPNAGFVLIYSAAGLEELRLYVDGPDALSQPGPAADGEKRLDVARLHSDAFTSSDADERATALERLTGSDEAVGRETALAMLESERDEDVLERVLHIVLDEAPPIDRIADFAAADRPLGPRVRALEFLTAHAAEEPRIAELFQSLATRDTNAEIRTIAAGLLNSLRGQ